MNQNKNELPRLNVGDEITAGKMNVLKYKIISVLPKGSNSQCYVARDMLINKDVVLKQYNNRVKIEQLEKDCQFMENSKSQVIAKGYTHFIYNDHFTVIMKYYENGTLQQYYEEMANGKHQTPNQERRNQWCRRIIAAVAQLHSLNQVHRNISPASIFVSDNEQNLILADFGSVVEEIDPKIKQKKQKLGSKKIETVAPEILIERPYTKAADMWSVGCVMYYIINECLPFNDVDEGELVSKITKVQYDQNVQCKNKNIDQIIHQLLILDLTKRPTAEGLIRAGQLIKPLTIPVFVDGLQQHYSVHAIDKIKELKEKIASDYQQYPANESKICYCNADGMTNENGELSNNTTIFEYLSEKSEKQLNIECIIILDFNTMNNDKNVAIQSIYSAFVKSMQDLRQNVFITVVGTSQNYHDNKIYEREPIQNISTLKPLNQVYIPIGEVTLLDTIGHEVMGINNYITNAQCKVDLATFFIITDDAIDINSKDFTEEQVKDMVNETLNMGWVYDFAGPQGKQLQGRLGVPPKNVTQYSNGQDATAAFTQIKRKIHEVMQMSSNLGVFLK